MEIYCKKCDKVLGHYPDEKIPLNVKGHTTCNLCGSRIELFRTEETPSTNNITEMPEAPVGDPSVPEAQVDAPSVPDAPVDAPNITDDIAKTIPILSGRKDRGIRKGDFMALGTGLLILAAIIFIYKPDFDPSKIFSPNLQAEFAAEMMNNRQGQGDKLPQGFPDMEGLEELEEAIKAAEEIQRKQ